jgi:hypothetical protein
VSSWRLRLAALASPSRATARSSVVVVVSIVAAIISAQPPRNSASAAACAPADAGSKP